MKKKINTQKLNAVIAIASHKRPEILQKKTLSLLKKHNIDMKKVFVFASPQSMDEYKPIAKKWGFNLAKGGKILEARNNIIQFFKNGQNIIEMDDDIEVTIKGKKNKSVDNLIKLFNESFFIIQDGGLFGFNANTNNFFAGGVDKIGFYSIINSTLGYVNDKRIKLTVPEKEDFERCIQYYKLGFPILKRTGYGIKTRYWKNKGGIQECYDFEKRKKVQKFSAEQIMKKYPWAARKHVRKNGLVDLRFKKDPLGHYKN